MHHRRDDEDLERVHTRADDWSKWMRSARALEKYRVLVYLVGIFLVLAGFGFRTPKATMDNLRDDMAKLSKGHDARIDSVAERVKVLERIAISVEALVRVQCVQDKPENLRLAGIDCSAWLQRPPNP